MRFREIECIPEDYFLRHLPLCFRHIAINPRGLGAEPPRCPTVVCPFNNQAKPNNRLRYLSWAKTISSPLAIVLAMCQGPLRLLPCRIAYFCGTFIASKFRRRGHDPRSFPSSDRISPISDSETRPIFSLILPRSIDRS